MVVGTSCRNLLELLFAWNESGREKVKCGQFVESVKRRQHVGKLLAIPNVTVMVGLAPEKQKPFGQI